jgi:hypothetical protein
MQIVVVLQRQPDLLEIVLGLRAPRRFASLLHGRKQQGHKDSDKGNHHQQFDQRKSAASATAFHDLLRKEFLGGL